jgi:hypothetical protein
MRLGVNACQVNLRMRVWSGGSAFDITGLVRKPPVCSICTTCGASGLIGVCAMLAEKVFGSEKIALMSS